MRKLLVLFFCAFSFYYAQDAASVIKDIQTRFGKIQDLTADVSQNSSISKFYYQKENKYRIETKGSVIVSDGSTIWTYTKKTNKVVISSPEDKDMQYTINNFVYSFPSQCKVKFEGKEKAGSEEFNIISMTPVKSAGTFSSIRIWSDNSNLIRKVNVADRSGSNLVFEFSNIRLNSNIPDSKFSFEPPKGSEVIDLR